MYLCLDCRSVFIEPKRIVETHGLDSPPYEEYNACPNCGGAFVEALICDGCDDYIINDYVETAHGTKYCEECYIIKNVED